MIQIEHFSKQYGNVQAPYAVEDVSFTVMDASVTALLGKNGAGKTTILKAICGFHYPSEGTIRITTAGNTYDCTQDLATLHHLIGFVPEQPVLSNNLTVWEFLHLVGSLHGVADQNALYAKVIADCALQSVLHKKIGTLSKGYKQRVSFAQALVYDPPILVLDEPSSGLDPVQIHDVHQLIKKLAQTKTILLSTHNLQEAQDLCTSLCILHTGKLVFNGTVAAALHHTASQSFEEAFLHIINEQ